jgi:hypothetical protein
VPSLDGQQEAIDIPNLVEDSRDMFFINKLEQKNIWSKDIKGERISKKPSFGQGSIYSLVVLCFLRY